jgi:hypothetical protein
MITAATAFILLQSYKVDSLNYIGVPYIKNASKCFLIIKF